MLNKNERFEEVLAELQAGNLAAAATYLDEIERDQLSKAERSKADKLRSMLRAARREKGDWSALLPKHAF